MPISVVQKWFSFSRRKKVDFSNRRLRAIPKELIKQNGLEELTLQGNELNYLSENICHLKELFRLDLSYNQLQNLPDGIREFSRLTYLNLAGNQFSQLPQCLYQLETLDTLLLHDNQLAFLHRRINKLNALRELDLRKNCLRKLPYTFGQLVDLRILYLNNNLFEKIPAGVKRLTHLEKLHLNNNRLVCVDKNIRCNKHLQELDLRNNRIETLPDSIGELSELRRLYLSNNRLRSLPDSIGKLHQLWELHLQGNPLSHLPDSIAELPNLQELHFYGTPDLSHSTGFEKLRHSRDIVIVDHSLPAGTVGRPAKKRAGTVLRLRSLSTHATVPLTNKPVVGVDTAHTKFERGSQTLIHVTDAVEQIEELPFSFAEKLGEGGIGQVYRAIHKSLNIEVAVKIVEASVLHRHNGLRQRVLREAQVAAKFNHPNIVRVMDLCEHNNKIYIVMEYLNGGTLKSNYGGGSATLSSAFDYTMQCCAGLQELHQRGYVHRDIKPENILFDAGHRIKLADFGIIKDPTSSLTETNMLMGTLSYMAPEQFYNAKKVCPASDVFSLGLCMYFMLTGADAFQAREFAQNIHDIYHKPTPHIRDTRPDIPEKIDNLIARATSKEIPNRFTDGRAFADAIQLAMRD